MTQQWTRVALKGKAQIIPTICPNCLGDANLKYRYGYKGIQGWLTRTTYYQTFSYCDQCFPQVKSALGLRHWRFFAGVMTFIFWIPLLLVCADRARNPQTGLATGLRADLAVALSVVLALISGCLLYQAARVIKHRRNPRRPGQKVWGLAAFYTGGTHLGFNNAYAVYKAARPEWIAALVRANPEQVEPAVYLSHVGAPQPAPAGRPFGPG